MRDTGIKLGIFLFIAGLVYARFAVNCFFGSIENSIEVIPMQTATERMLAEGFEPTSVRLKAGCSTVELTGRGASSDVYAARLG